MYPKAIHLSLLPTVAALHAWSGLLQTITISLAFVVVAANPSVLVLALVQALLLLMVFILYVTCSACVR